MGTTPNYGLVWPDDTSQMSDVTTYLNNNWTKIENAVPAKNVSAIPDQDFTYNLGDRVYHTGLKSVFICIGKDTNWGVIWRPVQAKYGPWLRPGPVGSPNSCLNDAAYMIDDANAPFQYRLTNYGIIQFRGSVKKITGTYPDFGATGTSVILFKVFPAVLIPTLYCILNPSPYPIAASTTNPQRCEWVVRPPQSVSGQSFVRVWNPNASVTTLFFSGLEYYFSQEN